MQRRKGEGEREKEKKRKEKKRKEEQMIVHLEALLKNSKYSYRKASKKLFI
jgi:hypothetical protein